MRDIHVSRNEEGAYEVSFLGERSNVTVTLSEGELDKLESRIQDAQSD